MAEEDSKGGKMPKLTIMEEVLLLGLKDKQVRSIHLSSPLIPGTDFRHGLAAVRPRSSFHALRFLPDCYGHSDEPLAFLRDTFRSGMTIYHMLYEGAFS